ncbi:MAG: cell division protein ZapA [Clostridia bacterium]|nr:cell division protein ZapA [Clostridia bacterium]
MKKNQPPDSKTRTKIKINGNEYILRSSYPSSYNEELAVYVDKKMKEIRMQNPSLGASRLAVLTALNITDELFKLQADHDVLLGLIEEERKK